MSTVTPLFITFLSLSWLVTSVYQVSSTIYVRFFYWGITLRHKQKQVRYSCVYLILSAKKTKQHTSCRVLHQGAPLTYFNDGGGGEGGGVRQRFIFYTSKNPNFRILLPKKIPPFLSIHKKIPQCFCIRKFYYLFFWKAKTCQLQLWFW